MTSAYPDIEGQLYTDGAVNAAYTEAEARQRAADRREVEAAASAAGASALADAKTYTDQKVSPLATTVAMNAADGLTLSNAKTYTDQQLADFDSFVGVPIFETLAEAQAWEVANPGKRALTLEPSTPDTVAPTWAATLTTATPNGGTVVITASTLASDDRAVAGYDYSLDAGGTWAAVTPSVDRKFTITGLESETTYSSVFLRARDGAGNVKALPVPSFTTPVTLAPAPTDYTYQWLGSSLSGTSWPAEKGGLTLTTTSSTPATVSGDAAVFTGSRYEGSATAMTATQGTYVFVSQLAPDTTAAAFLMGDTSNASRVITSPDFGDVPRLYGSWTESGMPSGSLDAEWHVAVVRFDPAQCTMIVDGVKYNFTPRNAETGVDKTILRLGGLGSYSFKGSIREIQVFNRAVSDGEAASINADLRAKYGIA